MWSWLGASLALAAPCEPMDEAEFRSYVFDAQSAIDRGDLELSSSILTEVGLRIPCLDGPPSSRMWADLLVSRAIVEFSRGGPWEDAMAAALRIRPFVDPGVGPSHPLARWIAPPPPPPGPPVPPGVRLFVDGLPADHLPPSEGLYLVQKTDGRFWNTVLVQDGDLPPGWAEAPVEQPQRIVAWGRVGAAAGIGTLSQSPSWPSDYWLDQPTTFRPALGVAGDLHVTFLSPFGVYGQASWTPSGDSTGLDLRAAAIWCHRGLTVGGGAGGTSVDTWEWSANGPLHRFQLVRTLHGVVMLRALSAAPRWDASLNVAGSGGLRRVSTGAGLLLPELGQERFRLGVDLQVGLGELVVQGLAERRVVEGSTRAVLRLDWVRGEY